MSKQSPLHSFTQAASVLPPRLRRVALQLPESRRVTAEEIRLRAGRTMTILTPDEELDTGQTVHPEDLEALCNLATEFSRYAAGSLSEGYLPIRGGCRVGLCGTVVLRDERTTMLKDFSSAVIRVAREKTGIANDSLASLCPDGHFASTLIVSPPGGGKTTFLRDLIRCLSNGDGCPPYRVALADERGEIAVMYRGIAQMDVGRHTDVLDGCPKALAIPMLLRTMNPQIIAVDEVTAEADLYAIIQAANCGVRLLATIHACDLEELSRKLLYRNLLSANVFQYVVRIMREHRARQYIVEELPPVPVERQEGNLSCSG